MLLTSLALLALPLAALGLLAPVQDEPAPDPPKRSTAGMPAAPLFSAARGTTMRMKLRNDTAWPHNIHLHGHHFSELSRRTSSGDTGDAVITERGDALQDTILLQADELSEIAFLADNPGKWMIHCHMLEHQASGMATWFEVS